MPAAGGSMGGMGGGGMSGGGMFHVPDQIQPQFGGGMGGMGGTSSLPASATQPGGARVGQLIQLIVGGVEPDSWDSVGGLATIHRVGHLLGINQTPAAHAKIEAVFEELRRRIASQRSVEVQLRLVTVEPQQANGLSQAGEEAWNELAAREQAIHLSVRCLDGQRASIAAGVRRSYVVKIVPVVGAAVEQATQSDPSIGYSPIVITPLVGVYGQILPQVMQRAESDLSKQRAEIDLGIVLASAPSEVTSAAFGTGQTIDRLELQTAELETSIVATENQWTLAGVAVVTDGTSNITAGDVLPHLAVLAKWTQAEE